MTCKTTESPVHRAGDQLALHLDDLHAQSTVVALTISLVVEHGGGQDEGDSANGGTAAVWQG